MGGRFVTDDSGAVIGIETIADEVDKSQAKATGLTKTVGKKTKKGTRITADMKAKADADQAGILEIREDNTEKVLLALRGAIGKALTEIGMTAEGYAKKGCPVDTGRLRNSITYVTDAAAKEVYIGTNVEYAQYVELGTVNYDVDHVDGYRFLTKAATEHSDQYTNIMKRNLSS